MAAVANLIEIHHDLPVAACERFVDEIEELAAFFAGPRNFHSRFRNIEDGDSVHLAHHYFGHEGKSPWRRVSSNSRNALNHFFHLWASRKSKLQVYRSVIFVLLKCRNKSVVFPEKIPEKVVVYDVTWLNQRLQLGLPFWVEVISFYFAHSELLTLIQYKYQ